MEAEKNYQVVVGHEPLDLLAGVKFVSSLKCGAIHTFSGTIRDTDVVDASATPQPIVAIEYEAYESMISGQISSIVDSTINQPASSPQDSNSRAHVAVRLGRVAIGEASIVICVSSTGRMFSHKATLQILERIKSLVTIWKRIIFADGSQAWDSISKSESAWLGAKNHRRAGSKES